MNTFNISQTLGEIVSVLPKASEVFKKHNIDFCCGGHRSLSEAIREQNLNEQSILNELDRAKNETDNITAQKDFSAMAAGELSDYIVNVHHVYLKATLPRLSELTSKILRVHGPHHPNLFKVHKLFHLLKADLEQHLIKEEEILFPLMKQYEKSPSPELLGKINDELLETEEEHTAAGNILKELRKVTDDYNMPEDGCGTFELTYELLEELESDLFQHIHLENNILFKKHRH